MRRVIVSNSISVDGFASGPNGELDWFAFKGFLKGTELGKYTRALLNSVDSILLGRQTYDEFSNRWPTRTDDDPVITERMNNLPKFVFSRSLKQVAWGNWGTACQGRRSNGAQQDEAGTGKGHGCTRELYARFHVDESGTHR